MRPHFKMLTIRNNFGRGMEIQKKRGGERNVYLAFERRHYQGGPFDQPDHRHRRRCIQRSDHYRIMHSQFVHAEVPLIPLNIM